MWLCLLTLLDARADPFFVWPERTPRGTVAFNPYVVVRPEFASAYAFVGAAEGLDVILGATGGLDAGAAYFGPLDGFVRAFPFPDAQVALVVHAQYTSPEDWFIGPELHTMTRPVDWLGLWADVGYRGRDRANPAFLWAGFELAASRPFLAFESDFELASDGSVSTTLIPSAGIWLGEAYATGVSVGVLFATEQGVPPGLGAWVWRSVDLGRRGRRIDGEQPGKYHVNEG
ncbi:MAG: hypothetical protein AAF602_29580, partial [Myxococcota bacterium]